MRKLDLSKYKISIRDNDGNMKVVDYFFKESVVEIMFHPDLKLSGRELLQNDIVAEKIEKSDNEVLLEEDEYYKVKNAIDTYKGFSRNEVEMIKRINNCPKIEVKEK
ncbi:MAG: hypothetical protein PHI16_02365 [Methanocellales archaeon]|jgi:hypothetical protein|nr:hypothetical protein [Methanocellales archaeon]